MMAKSDSSQVRGADTSKVPRPRQSQPSPDIKDQIGRQLKAMFDAVANEPVPDRLTALLDRLDQEPTAE
jgi:hypothetical protein